MTVEAMNSFLKLIDVPSSWAGEYLVIHAASADAYWLWTGVSFCLKAGGMS